MCVLVQVGDVISLSAGVGVTLWGSGGGGIVLALNVKAVEGINTSNVCALNQSQKYYFMFNDVLLGFICILLPLLC